MMPASSRTENHVTDSRMSRFWEAFGNLKIIVSPPYPDGSCMATSSKEASCGLLDQILCQDGICAAQKQLPFRYHYDAALGGPQSLAWRNLVAGPGFVSGETCICG